MPNMIARTNLFFPLMNEDKLIVFLLGQGPGIEYIRGDTVLFRLTEK